MRKRSSYRPKATLVNPIAYVIESLKPVAFHESYLIDLKIKNSEAMVALLRGNATHDDLDLLVAMSNVTEALYQLGFGEDYKDVAIDGREAILRIVYRAVDHRKFTPTGPEIQALNRLMELHDAQMDVITIKDMERALQFIDTKMRHKEATNLPRIRQSDTQPQ
jgi:hypothetical protein